MSNPVTIQTPAALKIISLIAQNLNNPEPKQISEGQTITVTMKVKNEGQANAINTQLTTESSGTGKANLSIQPSPKDIEGESEATFEWIYNTNVGDSGFISFSGEVSGFDFNSGEETSDSETSNQVQIQKPDLSILINAEHQGNPDVTRISAGKIDF